MAIIFHRINGAYFIQDKIEQYVTHNGATLKTHIDFSLEYALLLRGVHYIKHHMSKESKSNSVKDAKPELVRYVCLYEPDFDKNDKKVVEKKSGLQKL